MIYQREEVTDPNPIEFEGIRSLKSIDRYLRR